MSISIKAKTDYSSLFSNFSTGSSTATNSMFSLSDYASIKNGSYYKLMKAYYAKQDTEDAVATGDSKDSTKVNSSLQNNAAALSKSADVLLADGSSSVFAKTDITTKDEAGNETTSSGYDTDKIYKAVASFADDYNSLVGSALKSNNSSVVSTAANMTTATAANEKLLASVGITIGKDNKLVVDETAFKKADMTTVKSLFHGNGSFAYGVQAKASFINMYAGEDAKKASGLYSAGATYNSSLLSSGNVYNSSI